MLDETRSEFESVFRAAYASVLGTSSVVLHDRSRAEEVTQDAFLRLYERELGIVTVDHPEAWVRQVAARAAARQACRNRVVTPVAWIDESETVDDVPDVDLARAVRTLPARQRAAVALFYFEDRSVEEVSRLMGVSPSTVKQHLHRARLQLAAVLTVEPEDVREP